MVTLPTVPIPGLREAVQKERALRDSAFLGGLEIVCGIEVNPLSLRTLILLDQAWNGFVVPTRFDDEAEMLAHAVQVLYFASPEFRLPKSPVQSFWQRWMAAIRQQRFLWRVIRGKTAQAVIKEIEDWINDAMMDCPSGSASGPQAPSYASFPAYIIDRFAEAGLTFTESEIMAMPLRRLWQHWRLASQRVSGFKPQNPSDQIRVDYVEKMLNRRASP